MTRQRRLFVLLSVGAIVAVLAGCGGGGDDNPDELTGLITDVRGRGDDVTSFSLRAGDKTYEIRIASDVNYGFALSHLRAHQSALYPVRCKLERRQGQLYALEIVDA